MSERSANSERLLTLIDLWAVRRCAKTPSMIHLIAGSKNEATSDLQEESASINIIIKFTYPSRRSFPAMIFSLTSLSRADPQPRIKWGSAGSLNEHFVDLSKDRSISSISLTNLEPLRISDQYWPRITRNQWPFYLLRKCSTAAFVTKIDPFKWPMKQIKDVSFKRKV